jgi:hypothetical protein
LSIEEAKLEKSLAEKESLYEHLVEWRQHYLGAARGRAVSVAKRQTAAMMNEGAREMVRFWTGTSAPSTPRKRKKAARR